ncbi:MAG: PIN domain-containing protein [Actinomycetota bacterium]|nr:PIN domain-containing protein [Actinomycetota bacterium]MDD5668242.1 PIN domain-containing protein [Actinomycetota bacterium]
MKLLETSVIIRFLTRDDARKSERSRRLILESDERLLVCEAVVWETVYVLENVYRLSRQEIFSLLARLLSARRLDFVNRDLLLQAVTIYGEHAVSFTDAYQVAYARASGAEAIYTYDADFVAKLKFPSLEP